MERPDLGLVHGLQPHHHAARRPGLEPELADHAPCPAPALARAGAHVADILQLGGAADEKPRESIYCIPSPENVPLCTHLFISAAGLLPTGLQVSRVRVWWPGCEGSTAWP